MDTKRIYLECKDKLLLIIRRGVPGESDAEDVLHDVFSRFFLHPPNHIAEDAAKYYLIRCAVNAVAQWWRNNRQRSKVHQAFQAQSSEIYNTTPLSEAMKQEDLIRLQAAVAALPDRQQQALTLHYFGEYSYPEIAGWMNCDEATVRSHIRHGIKRLQAYFEEHSTPASKGA